MAADATINQTEVHAGEAGAPTRDDGIQPQRMLEVLIHKEGLQGQARRGGTLSVGTLTCQQCGPGHRPKCVPPPSPLPHPRQQQARRGKQARRRRVSRHVVWMKFTPNKQFSFLKKMFKTLACATGAGSARPVVSIRMWSNLFLRLSSLLRMRMRSPRTAGGMAGTGGRRTRKGRRSRHASGGKRCAWCTGGRQRRPWVPADSAGRVARGDATS